MPYLEYLFCEHCGNYAKLDLDPAATIEAYRKEGREQITIIQPTLIWDYLMYSCGICGNTYKYTYRDVEKRVRTYFSSLSLEFKDYFDKVIEESAENPEDAPRQQETSTERSSSAESRVRDLYTAKK
jgi:hypothetical protein